MTDEVLEGFSWVIEAELAGLARPDAIAPLDEALDALAGEGIRVLVSLTSEAPDAAVVAEHGIEPLHLPVADYAAPTQAQIRMFVERAEGAIAAGKPVAVHCWAGLGRTGTMLAAFLVNRGRSAPEAIALIRALRPGSIETAAQEGAVAAFAASSAPQP